MSKACIAAWTACIKELQGLANTAVADQPDAVFQAMQHVEQLDQQQPLPHAAWKRLVQDVQVN
jgi:hypothetical protein